MRRYFTGFAAAIALLSFSMVASAQCEESSKNKTAKIQKAGYTKAHAEMDIVDTAVSAGMFNTLVAAVKAAGLVDVLKSKGPFTVFAPTDEAFAKLPAGTIEELLKPENKDKLVKILTYHVVAGKVMAADVVKIKRAKTVQGREVKINARQGKVMIDKSNVIKTDIETSNGVIHVIDTVLMPN